MNHHQPLLLSNTLTESSLTTLIRRYKITMAIEIFFFLNHRYATNYQEVDGNAN